MSPEALVHNLPFNLGGLLFPTEARPKGFYGVLPLGLPFTLSAKTPQMSVAYNTVGWHLICRSHKDFQTELLSTDNMNSLSFSKELSAFGMASFSLNLDTALFEKALNDGSDVETLFDYENLWEISFDGKPVFQILGTAITESKVNDGENVAVTVSGSGTGKVLEWAQIYPKGFPSDIVTKLETLTDQFSGDVLNRDIWAHTASSARIATTGEGGYAEEQAVIDDLLQKKEKAKENHNDALTAFLAELSEYIAVRKNPATTPLQEKIQAAQLAKARFVLDSRQIAIDVIDRAISAAVTRRNFYGLPKIDESTGYLRLRLTEAGTVYATSKTYDIQSSGVSAGIFPAPFTDDDGGQTSTIFKVMHDPGVFKDYYIDNRNHALMYTQRLNGIMRLVAQISSNNFVSTKSWDYSLNTQRFWRIREDAQNMIFETSADNVSWTQRWKAAYSWPTTNVVFQFGLDLQGSATIAPPLSAYLYSLNTSTLPNTETAMQVFRQYLQLAQSRGTIPFVKPSFGNTADSKGRSWIGKLGSDLAEGSNLFQALESLSDLQQADWIMGTDFNLHAFQRIKGDEVTPPVYFRKEDVVFHEAGSQLSKEKTRTRENISNVIVGKNAAGQYAYIQDVDSIDKYRRREAFISAGNATDLNDLGAVLDSSLEELKEEKTSWRITVLANQPGRRVFEDYDVGDWIKIESIDTRKNISIGTWRVVGIAVTVASDATQTVELTLQSRKELLIERLKQQVANMSASSTSATNAGSAISAATLIEQATLAGLRDVVIENPVEGDVLTYSEGYWVPIAPGDKTVPATPQFSSALTNVYYPGDGISVRGQIELSWNMPLNTDGSFVSDGHHYEVKYKPTATADLASTWLESEQTNWNQTLNWAQPSVPANQNSGWNIVYVGWDELSTVIQELTPGMEYAFQIRAVDSSTPQHFSEWSEDYVVVVAVDSIAPDKPAPPVVASSYLAIQVTHYLGKATGGTFNLPPDMAYLEVHAGNESFVPNASTLIGKILADNGLIKSGTPVIQTFNMESTDNIYVRVIAVDQTGNKSAASNPVTATVNLIDDAHVSDLTASKITAGTISSSIILGGVIKTAETGPRAEMNFEGFRIFSQGEDPTLSLLGDPGINGNFLLIKDIEDPTLSLAGIDGTGRGSFQSLTVNDDITVDGDLLLEEIVIPKPKGIVAYGSMTGAVVGAGAGSGNERGLMELAFIAEAERMYKVSAVVEWESTANNDTFGLNMRDAGSAEPKANSPYLIRTFTPGLVAGTNTSAEVTYVGTFSAGLHRIILGFYGNVGVATVNPNNQVPSLIWVEDIGDTVANNAQLNDGGVDEYQKPSTPDTRPPAPKPKVTYTRTYSATWSATYRSNGQRSSSHGSTMVQGDSGSNNWLHDARSLCGFDYKKIMADTKGATIQACYITLYASHWYWNDGGTARIGTHNYTSKPSKWTNSRVNQQRVSSSNWPKPGKRKVNLGTTIGNEFKSGASKGIALGPTNGTKTQYGKINGNGQSNEPVLTIVFVR